MDTKSKLAPYKKEINDFIFAFYFSKLFVPEHQFCVPLILLYLIYRAFGLVNHKIGTYYAFKYADTYLYHLQLKIRNSTPTKQLVLFY